MGLEHGEKHRRRRVIEREDELQVSGFPRSDRQSITRGENQAQYPAIIAWHRSQFLERVVRAEARFNCHVHHEPERIRGSLLGFVVVMLA